MTTYFNPEIHSTRGVWYSAPGVYVSKYVSIINGREMIYGYVEKLPIDDPYPYRACVFGKGIEQDTIEMFNSESQARMFVEAVHRLEDT